MESPIPAKVLDLPPGPNNPRNSEGSFITLEEGRLLFVYTHYTGDSSGDHDPAHLAARISEDAGRTWTDEDQTILENEGLWNIMSVSLLRLQDGRIALFYVRKNSEEDCIPQLRYSSDEAATWTDPIPVITDRRGYFVLNNDRVIQLADGRLLAPVALHRPRGKPWKNEADLFVYWSEDAGQTWQSSPQLENPDEAQFQEPGVVELQDGTVLLFIRTNQNCQYFAFSHDGGKSWSAARPGNLPSPLSPASIKRLPEIGDLFVAWNQNGGDLPGLEGKRTPLNVALSSDEGKTWQGVQTLEDNPHGWYCYTAIYPGESFVLLAYCAGDRRENNGLAHTRITRIPLPWLYAQ